MEMLECLNTAKRSPLEPIFARKGILMASCPFGSKSIPKHGCKMAMDNLTQLEEVTKFDQLLWNNTMTAAMKGRAVMDMQAAPESLVGAGVGAVAGDA